MMERLINADELIKHLDYVCTGSGLWSNILNDVIEDCKEFVNHELTVDAVPVVHGQWLKATGMMPPEWFGRHVCSVCDNFAPAEFRRTHEWLSPICPHCGAKMDEKDGEQDGKT